MTGTDQGRACVWRPTAQGLVVIGCGARKTSAPAAPASLYTGSYFRMCLQAALAIAPRRQVLVLSARHGLLGLDDGPIEPYDLKLGQPGAVTAAAVQAQAATRNLLAAHVLALCSAPYATLVKQAWADVATPLAGLGIGRQRHALALIRGGSHPTVSSPRKQVLT
jgi:hypothetical protein